LLAESFRPLSSLSPLDGSSKLLRDCLAFSAIDTFVPFPKTAGLRVTIGCAYRIGAVCGHNR
jgi:hypothetical protein